MDVKNFNSSTTDLFSNYSLVTRSDSHLTKARAEVDCLINWNGSVYESVIREKFDPKQLKNYQITQCEQGKSQYKDFCYNIFTKSPNDNTDVDNWYRCVVNDIQLFLKDRERNLLNPQEGKSK